MLLGEEAVVDGVAEVVESKGRGKSAKDIHKIVGTYIDRGAAQENVEGMRRQKSRRFLFLHCISIKMVAMPTCEEGKAAVGHSPLWCAISTQLRKIPSGPGRSIIAVFVAK